MCNHAVVIPTRYFHSLYIPAVSVMDRCWETPKNKGGFHCCSHTAIHTCGWQSQSPCSYMSRTQSQWQRALAVRLEAPEYPASVKYFPPVSRCGRIRLVTWHSQGTPYEAKLTCMGDVSCLPVTPHIFAIESWVIILNIFAIIQIRSLCLSMQCVFAA